MRQSANRSKMAGSRSRASASRTRKGAAEVEAAFAVGGKGAACSRSAYPATHATAASGTSGSAGLSPQERRWRGDELRGHRHPADGFARKPEPAQVGREVPEDRSDVAVMEEVDAPEAASHSGSSVQRSGNCALLASAVVSLTFVSAISKV